MNYCIECKFYHYNTAKKAFECSMGIGRICESPCDSYVEDDMVWVKVSREHGRLIDADELVGNISDTYCEECPKMKPIMCKACKYEDIMDDIENAPTVLEAGE